MTWRDALRDRLRWDPPWDNAGAVHAMVTAQWRGAAARTPTYLEAYRDQPGSIQRSQQRAVWIAEQVTGLPHRLMPWTVLDLGCGCGRTLAALQRRRCGHVLIGIDLCPEAIREAQRLLPAAVLLCTDVTSVEVFPRVDVIVTCACLVHIEPSRLPDLVRRMVEAAKHLVLVEEPGAGEVVKGPRRWRPEHVTGDYVMWRPPLVRLLVTAGARDIEAVEVPSGLAALGATQCLHAKGANDG